MPYPSIPAIVTELIRAWAPPPKLLVSEWAQQFRHLSPEASGERGPWRNERAPHLVDPMDALSPCDPAERVVLKFSSQTGKTEVILNFNGYCIHLDPGPILNIQPNSKPMGEAFSKDRITPMVRDTPALKERIAPPKSRDSGNTLLHKAFDGGHLSIAGANSPSSLASRPIRYMAADEINRWDATKEGDALVLARKRLQTYRNAGRSKELITSSPTYADLGISLEYDKCTQQYERQLACQHCGEYQFPLIKLFSWDAGDPKTLRYTCKACGGVHTIDDEHALKRSAQWVQVRDGARKHVGYYMNQWSSPFANWSDTLEEWIEAQGDGASMMAVTNTAFAEDW